ncbi:hypothetical protein B0H17DRAFT_1146131 [Mycena rosella]|uniref:Uncharacterized protein n=1 Tax=Mycena rosella TaxID=1033263 RepID=A0AAD7CPG8_MYCRO|nr:hypothetical protein B0H17DRAFT_1146131 [Mycena rosella]
MEAHSLDSMYGAWLISLVLEIFLFGMGVLQTWIYFAGRPADRALESTQVVFFFLCSYIRFVKRFGQIQADLMCFFANRIHHPDERLTNIMIVAGIAQMIISYGLRSYRKIDETKCPQSQVLKTFRQPATALQTAASLACDLLIIAYHSIFFATQKKKKKMTRTKPIMDTLMYDTINRGILTTMSSCTTIVGKNLNQLQRIDADCRLVWNFNWFEASGGWLVTGPKMLTAARSVCALEAAYPSRMEQSGAEWSVNPVSGESLTTYNY